MDRNISKRFIKIITDCNNFTGQGIYALSASGKQFSVFDNVQKFISIFSFDKRYVYTLEPAAFKDLMEIMKPQRIYDTSEYIIPEEFEEMLEDFLLMPTRIAD